MRFTRTPSRLGEMPKKKKSRANKGSTRGGAQAGNLTRAQKDALLALLMDPTTDPFRLAGASAPVERSIRPLPLLDPPATPVRFRIRVDLVGAQPPLWRRLTLPSNLTLDQVHDVLQTAFGWTDNHLHQFTLRTDRSLPRTQAILSAYDVSDGADGVPESKLRLDQLLAKKDDKLHYTYDFGDDWEHLLKLEAVESLLATDTSVRCVGGRRQGAPEDVGGIRYYDNLLAAAADPEHPDLEYVAEVIDELELWDFNDHIDLDSINLGLELFCNW